MKVFTPTWLTGTVLFLQGLRDLKDKKQYQLLMNQHKNMVPRDCYIVKQLERYGKKYREFLLEFLNCEMECQRFVQYAVQEPIVVCVVKNDLMRMQLFIEYYRNIGVKNFAVLDDHSTDGTKEYLLAQPDVAVFQTEKGYTTVRRQAWINKIISQLGTERWYLIVDSDELFDYLGREQGMTLGQFADSLAKQHKTRVKALLLDMFAKDQLFSERVATYMDIQKEYRYFYPQYRLVKTNYGSWIKGGARGAMFEKMGMKAEPVVSKYPLVFVDDKEIILHSHICYPFVRNKPDQATTILRHYKFLPGDRKKYEERIKKQNFEKGSKEYIAYASAEATIDYAELAQGMVAYTGLDKVLELPVMSHVD